MLRMISTHGHFITRGHKRGLLQGLEGVALVRGGRVPLPQVRHFRVSLGELVLDPFRVVECNSNGTLRMTVLASSRSDF